MFWLPRFLFLQILCTFWPAHGSAADIYDGTVDYLPARIVIDGTQLHLCYEAPGFSATTVKAAGKINTVTDGNQVKLQNATTSPPFAAGVLTYKVRNEKVDGVEETNLSGTLTVSAKEVLSVKAGRVDPSNEPDDPPGAADDSDDVYHDQVIISFRTDKYSEVYEALMAEGVTLRRLRCSERLKAKNTILVQIQTLDIVAVARRLRAKKSIFDSVTLMQTEKGGDSISVFLPSSEFDKSTPSVFMADIDNKAKTIAWECFQGKQAVKFEELAGRSDSKKLFIIEGLSRNLAFGRPDHWERYKIELLFYTMGEKLAIDLRIVQGEIAAFKESSAPPEGRYETLDSTRLTNLTSKVAALVAKRFNGSYQPGPFGFGEL